MDQRLAVEAEIARLRAFLPKTVEIAEIAVGPVEDFKTIGAGGENAVRDHRQHGRATWLHADPRFARNIIRSEHEAGEPRARDRVRPPRVLRHAAPRARSRSWPRPASTGRHARRLGDGVRSSTLETFGTRMPSGRALAAIVTSSVHHGVSSALVRIRSSRLPNRLAAIACAIWSRASALASGATESSRSRIRPSAGRLRAFSSARAFDPGMNSRLRRGRIMARSLDDFDFSTR